MLDWDAIQLGGDLGRLVEERVHLGPQLLRRRRGIPGRARVVRLGVEDREEERGARWDGARPGCFGDEVALPDFDDRERSRQEPDRPALMLCAVRARSLCPKALASYRRFRKLLCGRPARTPRRLSYRRALEACTTRALGAPRARLQRW